MTPRHIQEYLKALQNDLWMRGIPDSGFLAEVESHLLEAFERRQAQGLSPDEAEREALISFGSVKLIGSSFAKGRTSLMQKILLALGILIGVLIAYIDSRPSWDDTGITVGLLLLASGLLTLLGYRRPWLIALVIGAWTPIYEIYASRNFNFLNILVFPAVILLICAIGAYAGWATHQVLRRTLRPA